MSHPTDPNCIFCKIVAGQIPCFKLLEDEETIAFMDINPVNPGHALAGVHRPIVLPRPADAPARRRLQAADHPRKRRLATP